MLDLHLLEDRDAVVGNGDVARRVEEHLVHPLRTERRPDGFGDCLPGRDVHRPRVLSRDLLGLLREYDEGLLT